MQRCNDASSWRSRQRQSGAHAVEYAIIFPVFFALLYGTIAYGLIFTMRLGLQHAAEEGARAGLRLPVIPALGEPQDPLRARELVSVSVASQQASWLNGLSAPVPLAGVCPAGLAGDGCVDALANGTPPVTTAADCAEPARCQMVVRLTYDYENNPIFPSLPGFGLIFPDRLVGQARALLDSRAITP